MQDLDKFPDSKGSFVESDSINITFDIPIICFALMIDSDTSIFADT